MNNGFEVIKESIPNQQAGIDLLERIYDVATAQAVFSEPVTQADYSVITASEISVGIGYGYGGGGGSAAEVNGDGGSGEPSLGYGGGGGGGGGAGARPVAAIEIGPHGVRVEPIVDPTKIALAFFTAFGAMFMMLNRMRQQARG